MISTITLNPCLDKTIYVNTLVCNDTNRILKAEVDAGGKGINCARMLAELGAEAKALAFVGGETGEYIQCVLARQGVGLVAVTTEKPTRTNICIEDLSGAPPTTLNERGGPVDHKE